MHQDVQDILISEQELAEIVRSLGERISRDYAGKNLLLVGILKGSVLFMSDLMRSISLDCNIDFMRVSSYGAGTSSSGKINIELDLRRSVKGYDVLIVEDILDSGRTLNYVRNLLTDRHPASIKICTLLDKPERRVVDLYADYSGAEVPDAFVVGYGLDYAQKYRNLPYIGVLKEEIYNS
jgi:hypoxanthine phosphoribosyltransferase